MIRDPSDGSVRNAKGITSAPNENKQIEVKTPSEGITGITPVIETTTSGLPTGSSKPENIARLEKSREWLKQYFHRKTEES
jgi:hypothetical protein